LPVGLWINRRLQQEADEARLAEERSHALRQSERILNIVSEELGSNIPPLEQISSGTITKYHLNIARWNAISAGGELRWITDIDLVDKIAQAYEDLEAVNGLIDKWLNTLSSQGVTWEDTRREASEVLKDLVVAASSDALATVKMTLTALRQST